MTQQYLRKLNLVVADATGNGYDFGNFRCVFTVRRGDMQTPNSLDVRIYNVKPITANIISQNEFTTISLSAGYHSSADAGNVALLFQGNICQFRKGRVNQLDSYVEITAADSDEAYNYAFVSATVPAGTKPGSIADVLRNSLAARSGAQQITQGYQPNFSERGCVRGQVLYGMARDELRSFARQNECKWSLQDGALTFIPYVSYIPSGDIPVISVATGLIGVPEQTQAGINIRVLLNPAIKIGQLIRLDSQINQFRFGLDTQSQRNNVSIALQNQLAPNSGDQQGLYYVMTANHTGDTRGQDWYTDLVCLAVDATQTNEDQANALILTAPPPIQRYGGT
jgi:hypothetical protein